MYLFLEGLQDAQLECDAPRDRAYLAGRLGQKYICSFARQVMRLDPPSRDLGRIKGML